MSTSAESLAAARPLAPNLRLRVNARKALSVALILVVWQLVVALGGMNPLFLPSPALVARARLLPVGAAVTAQVLRPASGLEIR